MGGECSTYGGEERFIQGFDGKSLRKRDHLDDPSVEGNIILIWIFRKWDVRAWIGLIWLRIGTESGFL
jgi:hypothetical protein